MSPNARRQRLAWNALSRFFGSRFAGTLRTVAFRPHEDWAELVVRTQRGGCVVVRVGHLHYDDLSGPQEGSVDLFVSTPSRPGETWSGGEYLFQVVGGELLPMSWVRDAKADLREWIREGVAA